MILLGLTGNPASGKSTIAERLHDNGAAWINADLIARSVLNRPETTDLLVQHFGSGIMSDVLESDGESVGKIDRKALATLVFGGSPAHKAALEFLESVLHPPTRIEITDRLRAWAAKNAPAAILDVPLLFESQWDLACDSIWCVDAPLQSRLDWSSKRGWDAAELQRRESNQKPIAEKRRLSNQFLFNDGTLADLQKKVDFHWKNLATMAGGEPHASHCFWQAE